MHLFLGELVEFRKCLLSIRQTTDFQHDTVILLGEATWLSCCAMQLHKNINPGGIITLQNV